MTAPAKPRTNTPAHPMPGTGTRAAGSPAQSAKTPGRDSEFAGDPFITRLANPQQAEQDRNSRRDIVEGLHVLEAQRARATLADDMYEGDVGMVYASLQVKKLLAKQGLADDEIEDFNYAKIPVEAMASRLQITAVKVAPIVEEDEDDEGEGSADKKLIKQADKAVKVIRRNNRLDVYEKALHKDASKHGEAFLFLWPVEDETGRVVSVDFRVNTAHTVAFVYDQEDPLRVAYVIKSWETFSDFGEDGLTEQGRKPVYRANLYYPGPQQVDRHGTITEGAGRVERWVTEPGGNPQDPRSWQRVHQAQGIEDLEEVAADEFGDADAPETSDDIVSKWGLTWFHFRNDVPCGRPEHVSAYGPQKLINKLVWGLAGTIDYLGFPQRYIMVDPKIDDPLLNDIDPDHPEDEDDDPEGEGGTSGLRSDPAAVWRLYGKATGQYSAADPDTFLKPLDRFITSMSELTGVPRYNFTKSSADLPSGEAARELNAEWLATVEDRKDRYDPEWQDAYELALRMMGIEGVAVDVRWKPSAPVNDMNGVNVLKAKGELGVPSEVLLNEAGYPDELVKKWQKSQEGLALEQRIALLAQLGTAVQALAAGVTAGVVSDNQMQAFIARIVGNLAEGTEDAPAGAGALPAAEFREPPPTLPPGVTMAGVAKVAGGGVQPGAKPGAKPAKKAQARMTQRPTSAGRAQRAGATKKAVPAKKPVQTGQGGAA